MTLATLSGCGRHQPPLVVLTLYHPRFFLFVFLCFQKHVVWKKDGKRDGSVILEPPHSHLTSPTTTIPVRQLSVVDTTFLSSLFSHHSWLRTLNSPHIPLRISSVAVAWYLSFVTGVSWSRELWQGEQADCRMFFEIIRLYDSEALGMAFCSALGAFCVCFAS
jgi:hypothetical protein